MNQYSDIEYRIIKVNSYKNPVTQELKRIGLMGKGSHTKFIPECYKYTSIENRLKLVQGLMDTDGYADIQGRAIFYSVSERLMSDFKEIIESLGGVVYIRKKNVSKERMFNGRIFNTCGYIYCGSVKLPSQFTPFKLSRKVERYNPNKNICRYIHNIEPVEQDECVCISVDAEDQLYVTENCIVTHNTSTSVSLCSIIVYKNDVEVTRLNDEGEYETFVEGGQVVAEWCGRFDDINETHQKLLDIIEWYNAWTVIEANIPQFITYMTLKKKIHYIVPSNQLIFTKQVDVKQTPNHPYGWKNIGTLFTVTMLPYLLAFCKEIIGYRKSDSGAEIPIYGIERIPSLMCMVEMGEYYKGLNVDRVVSLCALICFVEIQKANGAMLKKRVTESNLEKSPKNTKLYKGPFSSVGRQSTIRRSPFSTIK